MPPDLRPARPRRRARLRSPACCRPASSWSWSGSGLSSAQRQRRASCSEWTDGQAMPAVSVVLPARRRPPPRSTCRAGSRPIRARRSMRASAAILKALVRRYRRAGEGGPAARRDRDARSRPATAAGQGRTGLRAGNAEALATATAKRWQALLDRLGVAPGGRREARRPRVKQALVKAAQANVDRLRRCKDFTRIVAPFDGIVTARNTDIGALINAGASDGPAAVRDLRHPQAARCTSTCRRSTSVRWGSAPRRRSPCRSTRASFARDASRPRRARSTRRPARRACSSSSTTPRAS